MRTHQKIEKMLSVRVDFAIRTCFYTDIISTDERNHENDPLRQSLDQ